MRLTIIQECHFKQTFLFQCGAIYEAKPYIKTNTSILIPPLSSPLLPAQMSRVIVFFVFHIFFKSNVSECRMYFTDSFISPAL